MKPPRKYQLPQPAQRTEPATPEAVPLGSAPAARGPIYPHFSAASSAADGVNIIEAGPMPRLWLRIVLTVTPNTDAARTALTAANFASRVIAADKRLRLSVDAARSSTSGDELVLTFVLGRWGFLEAQWVEEVKPAMRDLAAGFEGAELKSVEVVAEDVATRP